MRTAFKFVYSFYVLLLIIILNKCIIQVEVIPVNDTNCHNTVALHTYTYIILDSSTIDHHLRLYVRVRTAFVHVCRANGCTV